MFANRKVERVAYGINDHEVDGKNHPVINMLLDQGFGVDATAIASRRHPESHDAAINCHRGD